MGPSFGVRWTGPFFCSIVHLPLPTRQVALGRFPGPNGNAKE
jgi:hypothetical protein